MKHFTSLLMYLILFGCIGGTLYVYRAELLVARDRLYETYAPCTRPITYSLGRFDAKFGISRDVFLKDINEAEMLWETSIDKELFKYDEKGTLKINLVYDYRQEATEKLKALGLTVDNDRATYDSLLAKYQTLTKEHAIKKNALNQEVANFQFAQKRYEAEVAEWNKKGGAPKEVYERLVVEEERLKAQVATIKANQDALNKTVDTINALVTVINRVAASLNVAAVEFNNIGKARGEEFEEGIYEATPTSTKIDIYEFENNKKLVRVLAHELGHALGLEHVDEERAVMYKYNQGEAAELSPADVAALKQKCKLE